MGLRMSEPILLVGIGILLALSLVFSARWFARSRLGRRTLKRLETVAPKLMSDIEADMGQLHAQIAVATRRLETSVEQMKSKTTTQLSEIAKSSESIARLKAEHADRTVALEALELRERAMAEQLRTTEAQLAVKTNALEELDRKLAQEKAELKDLMAFIDARDKLAEADSRHAAAMDALRTEKVAGRGTTRAVARRMRHAPGRDGGPEEAGGIDLGIRAHGKCPAARAHQRRRRRSRPGRARA